MKRILLLASILMFLSSCDREPSDVTTYHTPVINPSTIEVAGSLTGIISTDGNIPVEDAKVRIKGYETMTDRNGVFSFENVSLYQDGTFVEVSKPGYFQGSRKLYALDSEINVMQLELMAMEQGSSIVSTQNNEVEKDNLKINLPSGSYRLGANENYTGEMNVHIATINNNYNKMPGDLSGVDASFKLKALSNFGIFNITLSSQLSDELQLPENSKAQFELKLPEAEVSPLPSVISVFYFDQFNGTWIEKGEATLTNDTYAGEIDALGYWMLAEAYPYADIEGTLGSPDDSFPNTELEIHNREERYLNLIRPTRTGKYATRVPQEINLDVLVFHDCAVGNQTEDLGIMNEDKTTIDHIEIETEMENVIIEGDVKDCYGEAVSNSFVKISFSEKQFMYRADENGNFNYSFANCTDTGVTFTAIDAENQQVSDAIEIGLGNHIIIGDLATCKEIAAGFDISYDSMNWSSELKNNVDHSWEITNITGVENRKIFSSRMIDKNTGTTYLKAAFVIKEGQDLVNYQLTFSTQAFHLFGQCEFEEIDHEGIRSYRFHGIGDDVAVIDENIYPSNVDTVNFNLVYYD